MQKHLALLAVIATGAVMISACETTNDDKISQARACTDNLSKVAFSNPAVAAAGADTCDSIIDGIITPEASKIRFGNMLLRESKMAQIANMVNAMKTQAGGIDGMNGAIAVLVFSQTARADAIMTSATLTLSAGIIKIASLIYSSTYLQSCAGFPASGATAAQVQAQLTANIAACQANTAAKTAVATGLLSLQASACASPSDQASTDPNNLCFKSKQILGGQTDPTAILTALNAYLATQH